LSLTTKSHDYAKLLYGNKLFYLVIYRIVDDEKLNQRTLEERFNDLLLNYFSILLRMKGYVAFPSQNGFPK